MGEGDRRRSGCPGGDRLTRGEGDEETGRRQKEARYARGSSPPRAFGDLGFLFSIGSNHASVSFVQDQAGMQLTEAPDPGLDRLARVLADRASRYPLKGSFPTATLVWGGFDFPIDISVPVPDATRSKIARLLLPGYSLRSTLSFSYQDTNAIESMMGEWLIGGLAGEISVFDDAPAEGWNWIAELLVHLTGGSSKFYSASACSTVATFSNAVLNLSTDRAVMVLVLGED